MIDGTEELALTDLAFDVRYDRDVGLLVVELQFGQRHFPEPIEVYHRVQIRLHVTLRQIRQRDTCLQQSQHQSIPIGITSPGKLLFRLVPRINDVGGPKKFQPQRRISNLSATRGQRAQKGRRPARGRGLPDHPANRTKETGLVDRVFRRWTTAIVREIHDLILRRHVGLFCQGSAQPAALAVPVNQESLFGSAHGHLARVTTLVPRFISFPVLMGVISGPGFFLPGASLIR